MHNPNEAPAAGAVAGPIDPGSPVRVTFPTETPAMLFAFPWIVSPWDLVRLASRGVLLSLGRGTLECVHEAAMPDHARTARALRLVRASQYSAW